MPRKGAPCGSVVFCDRVGRIFGSNAHDYHCVAMGMVMVRPCTTVWLDRFEFECGLCSVLGIDVLLMGIQGVLRRVLGRI